MKFDKKLMLENFNGYAYTEYAECPNAMYFRNTLTTYRGGAEEGTASLTGQNKYLVTDISALNEAQKTKFYMDYGMLPGSPTQIMPALIVFDSPEAPIMIPAETTYLSLRANYFLREIAAVWYYMIFGG